MPPLRGMGGGRSTAAKHSGGRAGGPSLRRKDGYARMTLLEGVIEVARTTGQQVKNKNNTKINVKGSGQECPLHMIKHSAIKNPAELRSADSRGRLSPPDSFLASRFLFWDGYFLLGWR